jgi:hypothetical protein
VLREIHESRPGGTPQPSPADWAATVWLVHGCGLRIGEALAVNLRCRINRGKTLRVREQVNPAAQLRPLKFRKAGEFREIPLPE